MLGENFGEFGKPNTILPCQNSSFTKVASYVSYGKFTNILPKLWNDRFAQVLPCQNFALYGSYQQNRNMHKHVAKYIQI